MNAFDAFLFGAVQGLTEYLPVSSSAHLILLPRFLGTQDPGLAFDVFLHVGTLASTLIYFREDWRRVLLEALRRPPAGRQNLFFLIVLGTIPALFAGAVLHKAAESLLRGNLVLMTTLTVGGLLLWGVDLWRERRLGERRPLSSATVRDALWVGFAQCFALMPGMSRSGSTIIGGRLLGFDRASSARFSFLLSAPITAAALVFELRKYKEFAEGSEGILPLLIGGGSAFVFGMFAIGGLLRLLRRFGYLAFAVYRIALAITIWKVLGA